MNLIISSLFSFAFSSALIEEVKTFYYTHEWSSKLLKGAKIVLMWENILTQITWIRRECLIIRSHFLTSHSTIKMISYRLKTLEWFEWSWTHSWGCLGSIELRWRWQKLTSDGSQKRKQENLNCKWINFWLKIHIEQIEYWSLFKIVVNFMNCSLFFWN